MSGGGGGGGRYLILLTNFPAKNEKQATINIALEYMDVGTLSTLLKTVGKIDEPILGLITYQVKKEVCL